MTFVPGGRNALAIAGLEHLDQVALGDYLIDTHEVSNRRYAEFVRAGGYSQHEHWHHRFFIDGEELEWAEAMARFTDRTGEPGPAGWLMGHYPEGEADYPVSGVSWYEAAAFAAFSGRQLPTVYHWNSAACTYATEIVVPRSNFNGKGPAEVGSYPGRSTFGAADMAGNVREWCLNQVGDGERAILVTQTTGSEQDISGF